MTHANTEAVSDERFTRLELHDLFGDEMPIEAARLIFGPGNEGLTIGEIRDKVREIALSRRAANSAGGVEVKAKTDREMRDGMDCNYPDCGCCHDSKCSDAPAAEAEPVAWLEHAQRAYDILVSGEAPFSGRECRASYALTYIPGLRLTHPSSPVSAEVTEAVDVLKSYWRGQYWDGVTYQDRERIDMAFAALAALNGGRENG